MSTCFCQFCVAKAKERGIDPERARKGFLELQKFVVAGHQSKRPVDGYYVTLWRIMLRYPELLAWEMLWTDSLRETYAAIYEKVKSVKPSVQVGWHIWHNNSFNPIYRAEQDLQAIAPHSDFLKMVIYHNCGGERMATYIDNMNSSMFGDVPSRSCSTSTTASWTTRSAASTKFRTRAFRRTTCTVKRSVRVMDSKGPRPSCGRVSMSTFLRRRTTANVRPSALQVQLRLRSKVEPTGC